jgi:hypothetical protein
MVSRVKVRVRVRVRVAGEGRSACCLLGLERLRVERVVPATHTMQQSSMRRVHCCSRSACTVRLNCVVHGISRGAVPVMLVLGERASWVSVRVRVRVRVRVTGAAHRR